MKVRIFTGTINIDPSQRAQEYRATDGKGYTHAEMDRWLAETPNIDIKYVAQSHDYHPPDPMTCGWVRFVITVFYEKRAGRSK